EVGDSLRKIRELERLEIQGAERLRNRLPDEENLPENDGPEGHDRPILSRFPRECQGEHSAEQSLLTHPAKPDARHQPRQLDEIRVVGKALGNVAVDFRVPMEQPPPEAAPEAEELQLDASQADNGRGGKLQEGGRTARLQHAKYLPKCSGQVGRVSKRVPPGHDIIGGVFERKLVHVRLVKPYVRTIRPQPRAAKHLRV